MLRIRSNARADKSAKLAVKVRTIRFVDKNEGTRLFLTTSTAFINESRLTEFTLSTEFVTAKVKAVIGKGLSFCDKAFIKARFCVRGSFCLHFEYQISLQDAFNIHETDSQRRSHQINWLGN